MVEVAPVGDFAKPERTERSRQVTENKGQYFFRTLESRQVSENKGFIFVKPWNY
jgi:protocatechuate 3,4-dioxygenase beta subunit